MKPLCYPPAPIREINGVVSVTPGKRRPRKLGCSEILHLEGALNVDMQIIARGVARGFG